LLRVSEKGKIKKKYGIENERQALMDCLDEWTAALENVLAEPGLDSAPLVLRDSFLVLTCGAARAVNCRSLFLAEWSQISQTCASSGFFVQ